jgi:hypothetical protein
MPGTATAPRGTRAAAGAGGVAIAPDAVDGGGLAAVAARAGRPPGGRRLHRMAAAAFFEYMYSCTSMRMPMADCQTVNDCSMMLPLHGP